MYRLYELMQWTGLKSADPSIAGEVADTLKGLRAAGQTSKEYQVSILSREELEDQLVPEWGALAQRAIDPNPCLAPEFMLAAIKKFRHRQPLCFLAVRDTRQAQLVGLVALDAVEKNLKFPFPSYRLFRCAHSFTSGILLDKSCASSVLEKIVGYMAKDARFPSALRVENLPASSFAAKALMSKAFSKVSWYEDYRCERAVLNFEGAREGHVLESISRKRLKDLSRCIRKLEGLGDYRWRLVAGDEVAEKNIEAFLELEHGGWKGEQGTSLKSNPSEECFFRSVISRFAQRGQVFFTEVLVDGQILASSCNFVANRKVFAYKVAWNHEYKKYSPGMVNEYEFIEYLESENCDISYVDSGSAQNSYIDKLWPDREVMLTGYYLLNRKYALATGTLTLLRGMYRQAKSMWHKVS